MSKTVIRLLQGDVKRAKIELEKLGKKLNIKAKKEAAAKKAAARKRSRGRK